MKLKAASSSLFFSHLPTAAAQIHHWPQMDHRQAVYPFRTYIPTVCQDNCQEVIVIALDQNAHVAAKSLYLRLTILVVESLVSVERQRGLGLRG